MVVARAAAAALDTASVAGTASLRRPSMCAVTRSHNASAGASASSGTGVSSVRRNTSNAFGSLTALASTTTETSSPAITARPCQVPRPATSGRSAARSPIVTAGPGDRPRNLNGANEQFDSSATAWWEIVPANAADIRGSVSPSGAWITSTAVTRSMARA
ncbi:hypothetical protein [Lentzea guizhouensis]|uniref:hypothetical protein n=1 Tax=Lentzea guizhouensis TaxID=1586287 RepID=UPI0012B67EBA|nr:hypothetical protein [Lentzea guizhouensis]